MRWLINRAIGWTLLAAVCALPARAADDAASIAKTYESVVSRGVESLLARQAANGSFGTAKDASPAITAVVTTALLRHGRGPSDPAVAKALKYLKGFVQDDGGIHPPKSGVPNYETSLSVVCFKEANKDGRYDAILKAAEKWLKKHQWNEGDKTADGKPIDKSNAAFGGAGYGRKARPDLSNTQVFLDALAALGNGPDDPAVKNALVFVSRAQNLESEHNTLPFAAKAKGDDVGGFYYTPAAGGESPAGVNADGGLRSYASMTYAGLKSMIYCGVKPDDPRVKAVVQWIGKHYDLDSNPGMGDAGLYYYYHTFAKALTALGQDEFKDDKGEVHNWRRELIAALAARQQKDGSWVNANARWLEEDANLVTGYALLALSYCKPK
jgi:squalene-hopene/tetraprenyl-beta-curcumene cyclase